MDMSIQVSLTASNSAIAALIRTIGLLLPFSLAAEQYNFVVQLCACRNSDFMTENTEWEWTAHVRLSSVIGAGHDVLGELLEAMRAGGWTHHDLFGVRLAVEEALVNAIRHGNR